MVNLDEFDFWLAGACMFGYDDYMDRDKFTNQLYYRFRRSFPKELIRQRIDLHYLDPTTFFARVSYLRDKKIEYPWEQSPLGPSGNDQDVPTVTITEELLVEINNLIHFQEAHKIGRLLNLARERFTVSSTTHELSLAYMEAEAVSKTFLMLSTTANKCENRGYALFVADHTAFIPVLERFTEKSWWSFEEPERNRYWATASYPDACSLEQASQKIQECDCFFLATLNGEGGIQTAGSPPPLLRHYGRISGL